MKEPKEVRPTSSKVLQALFNILGPLDHRSFLDLFAGTGRISAEAWQRGARPVVAVELLRQRGDAWRLKKNTWKGSAQEASFQEPEMIWGDVRRALRQFHRQGRTFDIVFADPPYHAGWVREILTWLIHDELALAPGGMLVLEHSIREPVSPPEAPWCSSTRTYGETALSFFEKMSIAQEKPCPTGENAELPSETASGEEVCP